MSRLLVAFDFDGTLSDSEMTVLLGERKGVGAEMQEITSRAMNDEIGYAESLRTRVGLLSGLGEAEVEAALEGVRLRPGAADLLEALRGREGVVVAILTGGFERGVARALEADGVDVDRIVANRLVVEGGTLTGEVAGPLIEGTKDEALGVLLEEFGLDSGDAVAIGDGANDLPMLRAAGLAVGFAPKPAVRPHCDVVVEGMDELERVLRKEIAARNDAVD